MEQLLTQRMRVWHQELQRVEEGRDAEPVIAADEAESSSSAKGGKGGKKKQRGASPSQDLSSSSASSSSPAASLHYTGLDFSVFDGENPLSTLSYSDLTPYQRLLLLKSLCDYHLSVSPDFQSTLRDVLPRDCRIDPLGVDYTGHRYFYFGFPDYRIYRVDAIHPNKPRPSNKKKAATSTNEEDDDDVRMDGDDDDSDDDHAVDQSTDTEAAKHDDDSDDEEKKREYIDLSDDDTDNSPQQNGHKDSKKKTKATKQNGVSHSKGKDKHSKQKKPTAAAATKAKPASRSTSSSTLPSPPSGHLSTVLSLTLPATPAFRLLSFSPETLQTLIKWLSSGHRKDKAVAASLSVIYQDLQEGKGRQESTDDADADAEKKVKAPSAPMKRSERVLMLAAEREEQERQQRIKEEEAREQRIQHRAEIIAQMAGTYCQRWTDA